ncbi:murein L,D-transpeptidase catalytic domain family protein [Erythrobacter sp. LQ02-29]|uniref:murein L,D-transpeptidase catalytic domain-containing protein n=1 Tax=unclassified Erythrobacter TaxID=2633097 RepID=UPI001BFC1206|nr:MULTISPECIES: murein L,D-transpeptidase catalytic domain family protein [unclassified Erythrobacter]MCP9221640.1 murein L,D-transpeptidase catalytic domain family protein [Erythrobacter sp. LQ02-29]QWC57097.1 twin-arginine translocation pathway signal [Erythrobacter sp. 3-20A1M]
MKRRDLLKSSLAVGAASLLPGRVFAQPIAGNVRDRQLAEIAKRELAKAGSVIWRPDIVGIADFGLHSSQRRFHFVDLERGEVRSHYVAHGMGSDPEHDGWLNTFSNREGSNQTSRGAFITWEWYKGRYGTSIRLGGLDSTNSNALERYIVMHRASYAEPEHIARYGKLGRSNGCFAMGEAEFKQALLNLSGGRLLYSERLGLAEDGSTAASPTEEGPRLILPGEPTDMQRYNPGAY